MALTPNYDFTVLNTGAPDNQELFKDVRDKIFGNNADSNFYKVDTILGVLKTDTQIIIGDGVKKEFTILHNLNNATPVVKIYDVATNKEVYTTVTYVDVTQFKVSFFNIVANAKQYKIVTSHL